MSPDGNAAPGEEEGVGREQAWDQDQVGRRGLQTLWSAGLAQREGDTEVTAQCHNRPLAEALDGPEIFVLPPAGPRVSFGHWGNWGEILLSPGNHCQNSWLSLISQHNGNFALWESVSQKCRGN